MNETGRPPERPATNNITGSNVTAAGDGEPEFVGVDDFGTYDAGPDAGPDLVWVCIDDFNDIPADHPGAPRYTVHDFNDEPAERGDER